MISSKLLLVIFFTDAVITLPPGGSDAHASGEGELLDEFISQLQFTEKHTLGSKAILSLSCKILQTLIPATAVIELNIKVFGIQSEHLDGGKQLFRNVG